MNLNENINRIKQVMGLNETVTKSGWWNARGGLSNFMKEFDTIHYPASAQNNDTGAIAIPISNGTYWDFFPDGRWYQYPNANDALYGTNKFEFDGNWSDTGVAILIKTSDGQIWNSIAKRWQNIPVVQKQYYDYHFYDIEDSGYVARRGAKNSAVRYIQDYLSKLNYDIGPKGVDGIFGPTTEDAVKKFQQDNNLKVDGLVGKKTAAVLDKLGVEVYKKQDAEMEAIRQRAEKRAQEWIKNTSQPQQTDSTTNQK
jgi:hypothetical protein